MPEAFQARFPVSAFGQVLKSDPRITETAMILHLAGRQDRQYHYVSPLNTVKPVFSGHPLLSGQ